MCSQNCLERAREIKNAHGVENMHGGGGVKHI